MMLVGILPYKVPEREHFDLISTKVTLLEFEIQILFNKFE